jgi:hypothetical protein
MIDLEKFEEVVREAGYLTTAENGGISFKVEGTPYRFETFENDDSYARLRLSFLIPPNASVETLLRVANEQNRKSKVVKTVVYPLPEDNCVNFNVELVFSDITAWSSIFERSLAALRIASDEYYSSLGKVEVV